MMNSTDLGFNATVSSDPENATLSILTSTLSPAPSPAPPFSSTDIHDPEFTILVVLGLSLLLAGFAAFLAVCRPSGTDGDSDQSWGVGGALTRGRGQSSEPQLKVWKRLGSYRRSYNLSFRRPPHRRPHDCDSTRVTQPLPQQTPPPLAGAEPHLTTPCLFDYVTEI